MFLGPAIAAGAVAHLTNLPLLNSSKFYPGKSPTGLWRELLPEYEEWIQLHKGWTVVVTVMITQGLWACCPAGSAVGGFSYQLLWTEK